MQGPIFMSNFKRQLFGDIIMKLGTPFGPDIILIVVV